MLDYKQKLWQDEFVVRCTRVTGCAEAVQSISRPDVPKSKTNSIALLLCTYIYPPMNRCCSSVNFVVASSSRSYECCTLQAMLLVVLYAQSCFVRYGRGMYEHVSWDGIDAHKLHLALHEVGLGPAQNPHDTTHSCCLHWVVPLLDLRGLVCCCCCCCCCLLVLLSCFFFFDIFMVPKHPR